MKLKMSICVLDELRLYLCKDRYYSKDIPSVKEGFAVGFNIWVRTIFIMKVMRIFSLI